MVTYGEENANVKITPTQLTRILRSYVGTDDVTVKTHRDKAVDKNQVVIAGLYDPEEDSSNFSSITIYATYNPDQKKIAIKDLNWKQLCIDLIECVGHEIVHQAQFRSREFDIGPNVFVSLSKNKNKKLDQEYLGNLDEVEAYGYSIATEIYLKYSPKEVTQRYIERSSLYKAYVAAFGAEHTVVKKLIMYINAYYASLMESTYVKRSKQIA